MTPPPRDRQPDFCIGEVIGTAQRRNPTSPSEVVGEIRGQPNSSADEGICDDEVQSSTVALCTLDGELSPSLPLNGLSTPPFPQGSYGY